MYFRIIFKIFGDYPLRHNRFRPELVEGWFKASILESPFDKLRVTSSFFVNQGIITKEIYQKKFTKRNGDYPLRHNRSHPELVEGWFKALILESPFDKLRVTSSFFVNQGIITLKSVRKDGKKRGKQAYRCTSCNYRWTIRGNHLKKLFKSLQSVALESKNNLENLFRSWCFLSKVDQRVW